MHHGTLVQAGHAAKGNAGRSIVQPRRVRHRPGTGGRGQRPDDYKNPEQFFARTCFTRVLRENSGLVLSRLAGKTENTAPVQTLVTQMGGGKTHMLTTLWHLANSGAAATAFPGIGDLLKDAGLAEAPKAKVKVKTKTKTTKKARTRTDILYVTVMLNFLRLCKIHDLHVKCN